MFRDLQELLEIEEFLIPGIVLFILVLLILIVFSIFNSLLERTGIDTVEDVQHKVNSLSISAKTRINYIREPIIGTLKRVKAFYKYHSRAGSIDDAP